MDCGKLYKTYHSQSLLTLPVSTADLQSLTGCITSWQAEEPNWHTDLDHEKSDWTGRYYSGFLRSKPTSWRFATAIQNLTAPAPTVGTAVRVLNLKESRDFAGSSTIRLLWKYK